VEGLGNKSAKLKKENNNDNLNDFWRSAKKHCY